MIQLSPANSKGGPGAHPKRYAAPGWHAAGEIMQTADEARGGLLGLRDLGGQRFGHGSGQRGVPPRARHPPVRLVLAVTGQPYDDPAPELAAQPRRLIAAVRVVGTGRAGGGLAAWSCPGAPGPPGAVLQPTPA